MRLSVGMVCGAALTAALLAVAPMAVAQPVPKPFPKPNPPQPPSAPAQPAPAAPAQPAPTQTAKPSPGVPTEATLGLPIYPGAEFLTAFDAGMGQRYYLFGTNASFGEIVVYYKTLLKTKGELVFDAPATHLFEVGRFREETMAYPPGVTVKDYTWNGSEGYLHVTGAKGTRYRTVIQLVPVPAGSVR